MANSRQKAAMFTIHPGQTSFSLGELPNGWLQLMHPDGQPYFYHEEKRIITGASIWDSEEMQALEHFVNQIDDFTRARNLDLREETHLVLELTKEGRDWWCAYYYASHSTRSLAVTIQHNSISFGNIRRSSSD